MNKSVYISSLYGTVVSNSPASMIISSICSNSSSVMVIFFLQASPSLYSAMIFSMSSLLVSGKNSIRLSANLDISAVWIYFKDLFMAFENASIVSLLFSM